MKFSVAQPTLASAVTSVSTLVPQRSTLPILSNFLFELEGDRLRITGTDLDVYMVTEIDVDGAEDGVVTIPARTFTDVVRELPSEGLSLETEDNQTTIRCGRRNYRFLGMTPADFPQLPSQDAEHSTELPIPVFVRALQHTSFAVSTDESRPNLQGALFRFEPERLTVVASDSHRLARYQIPRRSGQEMEVIVPHKALQLLQRSLGSLDGMLHLEPAGAFLACSFARSKIFSRLIEGPFPDYNKVIPFSNDIVVPLDREELIRTLRRVSVFASDHTRQVRFDVAKGEVSVSTTAPEIGDARETIDTDYRGDPVSIAFNALYVLEMLRHIESDRVILRLGGPEKAALIEPQDPQDDEDYLCLVMPLRLGVGY